MPMECRLLLPLSLLLVMGTAASGQKLTAPIIEPVEVEAATSSASGIVLPPLLLQVLFAAHLESEAHDDPDALAIERMIFQRLTEPQPAQPAAAMASTLLGSAPEESILVIHCLRDLAIEAMLAGAWDFEADRSLGKGFEVWMDGELVVLQTKCRGPEAQSPRG